jgi:3'(2'), 5'-bisphosphate nucleotidase
MTDAPASLITPALIAELITLARDAGAAIMDIYRQKDSYQTQHKSDASPLTAADLAAHRLICARLPALLDLPIVSEEGALADQRERAQWQSYWLLDPLDGTKEFLAGNGEFTVNIALIHQGSPILGVVHLPPADTSYLGVLQAQQVASIGAWKYHQGQNPQAIQVRSTLSRYRNQQPLTLLLSHRHGTDAVGELLSRLQQRWPGDIETINAGSSLKFCAVAEGRADCYPRLAPTCEWDTAAAQAVLTAAGGRIVQRQLSAQGEFQTLNYNKADILNPHFYALGDQQFDWLKLLHKD